MNRRTINGTEILYRDHYTVYKALSKKASVRLCCTSNEIYNMLVSPFFAEELTLLTKCNKAIFIEDKINTVSLSEESMTYKDQIMYLDYALNPMTFIVGTLHSAKLFDSRSKTINKLLYQTPHWTDLIYSLKYLDNYQYVLTLDEHICIYDVRYSNNCLQRILHCYPENPPNHLITQRTPSSFMNSYKCCESGEFPSSKIPFSCTSDIIVAYNDLTPSYSLLLSRSNSKPIASSLSLDKDTGHLLIEKCKQKIFNEGLNAYISPILIYTPSLITEYSKVKGMQIIPLKDKVLIFAVDNIGTMTLEAFKKSGEKIERVKNKERVNIDEVMDIWRAQYLWKYQRSSSEENVKEEVTINGVKKTLFDEYDLRKFTEKVIKKSIEHKDDIYSENTHLHIQNEEGTAVKKYNKRGYVTKEHINYLKYTWNNP